MVRRVVSRLDVRALSTALCGLQSDDRSRIPESRMSQLPTNPILAALPTAIGNRRISAGFTVDAASRPRRPTTTHACTQRLQPLTTAQSYQRRSSPAGEPNKSARRSRAPSPARPSGAAFVRCPALTERAAAIHSRGRAPAGARLYRWRCFHERYR